MFVDYFVVAHLTALGIFENQKYKNYEKYLSTLMIAADIIIFFSFINALLQAQTYFHRCFIISTMLGAFVFGVHRAIAIFRKKMLLRIVKTLKSDPPFFNNNQVKIYVAVQLSENFYPAISKILCILVILGILPYSHALYNDSIDYNNPDLYVIPYLYHFRNTQSFRGFAVQQILQCVTIGHFAFIYFSFIGLVNYVIYNIEAHMIEFNLQIDNLINDFVVRRQNLSNNLLKCRNKISMKQAYDNQLVNKFFKIIQYQLFIQRYIKDFANFLGPILSFYILQFVFLAFGYTVLGTEMLQNNAATLLQNLSALVIFLYGFYTWCHVCETVSHTNELLLRSLYNTKWYTLPLRIRKFMFITMMHTQRSRSIKVFGIFTINFALGLQVLKAIYSMVNFLVVKRNSVSR